MKKNQYISKNMLKGILFTLLNGLFLLSSCSDDIIDKKPITEIVADNAFNTEQDVLSSLNAAYDVVQWQFAPNPAFPLLFQGVRADDLYSQSASFWADGQQYDQFNTILPTLPTISSLWSKWYQGIARANFTIKLAEGFGNFETPGLQDQIIAEAKFLRGLYYFELVRLFGGVPLFEEAITSSDQELFKPRSTASEVYAFIESDLQDASAVLPLRGNERIEGSATSGAALGLLSKVFLYQKKWTSAVSTAEQVINQGVYSLETDFKNNFLQTTEFGPESLFEINYVDGFAPSEGSIMWKWSFPFLSGTYPSFNNFIPRQTLVDFFDNSDQRKAATFLLPGQILNSPGLAALNFDPVPSNFNYAIGVNTGAKKYFLNFEEVQVLLDPNGNGSPLNEKILRYADVLLIHAEASIMGGGGDGASSFQLVVNRAYGVGNPVAPAYTLQGVKDERRRELATEGWNRFTDLVRWGDAETALNAIGKNFTPGRDELLPIPQEEINTYPVGMLSQNPGYNN